MTSKGLVFVQGNFMRKPTYNIMEAYGFEPTFDINAADCVVWTGGEDINPAIYGESNVSSYYDSRRDRNDLAAIRLSVDKFKVGICRGAQLLNCIPNDGRLWQDVDNHGGGYHEVLDLINNKTYTVNSVHHQAMRVNEKIGGIVVASCQTSTRKIAEHVEWSKDKSVQNGGVLSYDDIDAEVVWYPHSKSLLFQGHPEFSHRESLEYFYELMDRYYRKAA